MIFEIYFVGVLFARCICIC